MRPTISLLSSGETGVRPNTTNQHLVLRTNFDMRSFGGISESGKIKCQLKSREPLRLCCVLRSDRKTLPGKDSIYLIVHWVVALHGKATRANYIIVCVQSKYNYNREHSANHFRRGRLWALHLHPWCLSDMKIIQLVSATITKRAATWFSNGHIFSILLYLSCIICFNIH